MNDSRPFLGRQLSDRAVDVETATPRPACIPTTTRSLAANSAVGGSERSSGCRRKQDSERFLALPEVILMPALGHDRSFGDVGSMSGLRESGHGWAIYEYTSLSCVAGLSSVVAGHLWNR